MKQFFTIALGLLTAASAYADFTNTLAARWTFNDTASETAALTDDISQLVLKKGGNGADQTLTLNPDGTVSLGAAVYLVCEAVNSGDAKFAPLKDGVTIWARVKYVDKMNEPVAFTYGLSNLKGSGDWANTVLIALNKPEGLGNRGICVDNKEFGMGSGWLPAREGDFSEVALVFNGKTKKSSILVDGKEQVRNTGGAQLADFASLMIGRLKATNGQKIVVDELRVYSSALSSEWIGEIEKVEK